jgi:REP element-mobilizing transposase RayT
MISPLCPDINMGKDQSLIEERGVMRVQYPDAWYHVMNRGRRGEAVYADEQDFKSFIALLQETCAMWNIRVAAYCLMSNHYHVLLQMPEGNLDRCMRHING